MNMGKGMRVASVLLTAILLMGNALSVSAAFKTQGDFTKDGIVYKYNGYGNRTVRIVGYTDKLPDQLTIPEKLGGGYVVSQIDEEAFAYSNLRSVEIPGSVTEIGEDAFEHSSMLKEVKLSYGLTEIGENAFEKTAIKSITVPGTVLKVGDLAFLGCFNLESATFDGGVEKIGYQVFAECKKLTAVYLPKQTEVMGNTFGVPDNEKLTLYGRKGTIAETLANQNGYAFSSLCTYGKEHTYSGTCDRFCDVCREERTVTVEHHYGSARDDDCNICDEKRDLPTTVTTVEETTEQPTETTVVTTTKAPETTQKTTKTTATTKKTTQKKTTTAAKTTTATTVGTTTATTATTVDDTPVDTQPTAIAWWWVVAVGVGAMALGALGMWLLMNGNEKQRKSDK